MYVPNEALDPVMGDDGKMYVPEEVLPAYKSLLKDADMILPNQFEAEYVLRLSFHVHGRHWGSSPRSS